MSHPKPASCKEPTLEDFNVPDDFLSEKKKWGKTSTNIFRGTFVIAFICLIAILNFINDDLLISFFIGIPSSFYLVLLLSCLIEKCTPRRIKKAEASYKHYCEAHAAWEYWCVDYPKKLVIEYWENLNGYQFEDEVAEALQVLGCKVRPTKYSGDGGVDIYAEDSVGPIYVQCKAHKSKVGVAVVRELIGVLTTDGVSRGCVVATHGFTKGAIELAERSGIKLVDVIDLIQVLRKHHYGGKSSLRASFGEKM